MVLVSTPKPLSFCVEVGLLENNRQGMTPEFVRRCDLGEGGPINVPLTSPRRVKSILGECSCLFCSFSYLITGTKHVEPYS